MSLPEEERKNFLLHPDASSLLQDISSKSSRELFENELEHYRS